MGRYYEASAGILTRHEHMHFELAYHEDAEAFGNPELCQYLRG
jgi:hypothetical protein